MSTYKMIIICTNIIIIIISINLLIITFIISEPLTHLLIITSQWFLHKQLISIFLSISFETLKTSFTFNWSQCLYCNFKHLTNQTQHNSCKLSWSHQKSMCQKPRKIIWKIILIGNLHLDHVMLHHGNLLHKQNYIENCYSALIWH